ncbi:EscT/YscT/HrcT family type III secretion system export apparatus protein [Bordetella genomosp. 9]|uniref:type III secretion system export apparatus subunit SctT n=1 Tax=Bordetella genomosp. 9 TaxID=1416803 RepID=UPI000A28DFA1|nr:type III secretion system export apparatus subunit SctT [Bordetella genomosp. 9]ARP89637.1 EscT/YscT/HrcT family type III secretion system export apparatus protein [Bordetella genomosp. 9]
MSDFVTYAAVKDLMFALTVTQPRILVTLMMLPVFSKQLLPGRLRGAVAVPLGLLVTPLTLPGAQASDLSLALLAALVVKEAFVGVVLGFFAAIPFWIFEAMGSLIDYQRGASMGALFNPTMGTEATPLAIVFQLAFGVLFLSGDGINLMLSMLFDSFRLWDPWQWAPSLRMEVVPIMLSQLDRLMRLVLLFAAPAMVMMLLAELGLALASRFTPQLQVFFLAMPIKTAIALLVIVLCLANVFQQGALETRRIADTIPLLTDLWRAP